MGRNQEEKEGYWHFYADWQNWQQVSRTIGKFLTHVKNLPDKTYSNLLINRKIWLLKSSFRIFGR
jgi:hypothetical protein